MNKDVLIVGSNTAGLQASLDLAEAGRKVHIVEANPFLEKNISTSIPEHILNARLLEISRHPNITVWTNTRIHHCEGQLGDFGIELQQNPRYVDLARCTACGECIEVCPVTVPGTNYKAIYLNGQPGCMAIDKLGKPPCANTCPGGIHVQGYVALIAQGRFQEAIDLIREAIPFPGICGRVCTHPCEINCRRSEIDKPIAVRLLKRFVADWELEQGRRVKAEGRSSFTLHPPALDKRVAVVGAGPGGMAVANRLACLGYPVTVFEKLPVIGGMMAIGIPEYRLPRDIIAREYRRIQDLGVEIKLNTTIGPHGEHTLDDLFEMGYDAICLAIGAHKSQSLHIPGEELIGVVHGIELLKTINLSQQLDDRKYSAELEKTLPRGEKTRIAILGGGNTAMDVSRSLKRLGVNDVRILYRRTRAEMPAMPEEVEDAEKEGVQLAFLVSPVRVLGNKQGQVIGLECIRMELGIPDSSGRRRPVPIAGSEFMVDLDMVILAIGQSPDLDFMGPDHEIAVTRSNRINVADINFMTNRPGIFAVGDAVTKDKMVVIEAIGMGKKAAAAIDLFLQGHPPAEIVVDSRAIPIANRDMTAAELAPKPRTPVPTIPTEKRVSSFTEVELGYTPEQAVQEAQRCLACGPCSACQACVQVCKPQAINHNQQETFAHLEVGAIIFVHKSNDEKQHLQIPPDQGIFQIDKDDILLGSAIAAQCFTALNKTIPNPINQEQGTPLSNGLKPWHITPQKFHGDDPCRNGVFICECGDQISKYIDTKAICRHAASWPGVAHVQIIPFSCSPEGAEIIDAAIKSHQLNRIVLAGCSCCSIDQICYSCTFQRVRCKDNLNLFTHPQGVSVLDTINQADASDVRFVLVNIREQCAWIHPNDRQKATDKAAGIVAASVARALATPTKISKYQSVERSTLILGNGKAAENCMVVLQDNGISVYRMSKQPDQVWRANGKYIITLNGNSYQASAVVLAPEDTQEFEAFNTAFNKKIYQPRIQNTWSDLETHRPGVYYLNPKHNARIAGAAAASRVIAWLQRSGNQPLLSSVVNPSRCRACGTCVDVCEFGAPTLVEENGATIVRVASWIDPAICFGCGTCVTHCPSGAITAGYSTDAQIESMLSVILAN